ncbi:hypothetical protein BDK88_1594 [Natrinema hispanicum]|uniref:Uncharacterized protein n=1 Tax=Natrinema hispanicum TaxID=392421 RepID=A0A482Y7A7_9EURY|nr:hypothetical protein [Natrinema hispanicum]RZV10436.1 hypothetical protein BDK88_1594 [Natrinema hispanicum]
MQTRTNPFIIMAGLYLTVGLAAIVGTLAAESGLVESLPRLRWVLIHLATIGGLTQAVFGVLPSLVTATDASARRPATSRRWLQWLALNAGYPLLLLGMATGATVVAVTGGTIVLGALGLLLSTVVRTSGWAMNRGLSRYYRLAPWFLVVGILAAFGMLLGIHGPGGYFGSLEAHVHANVWGFLALIVAGALLTLLPALLEAELRYPRLVSVTFWGLTIGVVGLVAGPWLARHEVTVLGLGSYVVGTGALLANVVGTYRSSDRSHSRRIALVLGAYLWLAFPVPWAPFVLLVPDLVPASAIETAAINGLIFGWMLQLAMAFLPVVAAAFARPVADHDIIQAVTTVAAEHPHPSWIQVGSVNLGMLVLWLTPIPFRGGLTASATLAGFALIAVAWALFVVSLWRSIASPTSEGGTRHSATRDTA